MNKIVEYVNLTTSKTIYRVTSSSLPKWQQTKFFWEKEKQRILSYLQREKQLESADIKMIEKDYDKAKKEA